MAKNIKLIKSDSIILALLQWMILQLTKEKFGDTVYLTQTAIRVEFEGTVRKVTANGLFTTMKESNHFVNINAKPGEQKHPSFQAEIELIGSEKWEVRSASLRIYDCYPYITTYGAHTLYKNTDIGTRPHMEDYVRMFLKNLQENIA